MITLKNNPSNGIQVSRWRVLTLIAGLAMCSAAFGQRTGEHAACRREPSCASTTCCTSATQFTEAYKAMGSPSVLVIASAVKPIRPSAEQRPSSTNAPSEEIDSIARMLCATLSQDLADAGVQLVAPHETNKNTHEVIESSVSDPARAALSIGRASGACIAMLCFVEKRADTCTATYVIVNCSNGQVIGSWAFDLEDSDQSRLDSSRITEYARALGKEVRERLLASSQDNREWTIEFDGLDDDARQLALDHLCFVRGISNFRDVRTHSGDEGKTHASVRVAFQHGGFELGSRVRDELRLAGLPVVVASLDPGRVRIALDRTVLVGDECALAGDTWSDNQGQEAVAKACAKLSFPPLGVRVRGRADPIVTAAVTARLRKLGLRVIAEERLTQGDLELAIDHGEQGEMAFTLGFVGGDAISAVGGAECHSSSADGTARAAVARLVSGLVSAARSDNSITLVIRDARTPEDVLEVAKAVRTLRGVRVACVRRMEFGSSGGDVAEVWIASDRGGPSLISRLRERSNLSFGFEEASVRPDRVEILLKEAAK